MRKSICKNCGLEIGEWTDPWGGHPEWMHGAEDGPDAHADCRCKCAACRASEAGEAYEPKADCCDGEEAEPV
jgi:hypothetical protein